MTPGTASIEHSPFELFAALPLDEQQAILAKYTNAELKSLQHDWPNWLARPKQRIPAGNWQIWLELGGRGAGKTRTGSETVREWVKRGAKRIALLGRTVADVRDTMLYGISGIMNIGPEDERPVHQASTRRLLWPNGAEAILYSADVPAQLRGPAHEKAWVDELAQFRYPDAWDQLLLGLREGDSPQVIVTTTPRPTKLIRALVADPTCHLTPMTTYENVQNLAESWQRRIITRYEGSRLGRQELMAEILLDTPGALWTIDTIDAYRVREAPQIARIVVSVDVQAGSVGATTGETEIDADELAETGITVVGLGADGHGYVLEDATVSGPPAVWAKAAIDAYYRWHADTIYAEANNGGQMVGFTLATVDPRVPTNLVWAARGKYTRAEPISALYDRGWVHHVGYFADLESQMTTWVPGEKSPDRMDALVWGLWALFLPTGEVEEERIVREDEADRVRISDY